MAHFTPKQQVVIQALELVASVSAAREKLAISGKRQSSALVDPYIFGKLAALLEEQYPGTIAKCREENKRRDDAHRAEVRRIWAEQAKAREQEMLRQQPTRKSDQP